MRRWSRTVAWTLTGFAAIFGHFLFSQVYGQNLAARDDATPIARVIEPYGEGVKDITAIKDGIVTDQSYDSYDGANVAGEDWYGYTWPEQLYFDKLVFYEGMPSEAGGYWKGLTVQYTMDGTRWIEAGDVAVDPAYDFSDKPNRQPYGRYELTFTGCLGSGVRIYGRPGGPACYTSIAELEVYGTKPSVLCTRDLPTSYQSGQDIPVLLNVIVEGEPPPSSLAIVESIPAGLTISDAGTGDTSQPGQISWSLGEGEVVSQALGYSLAVPAGHAGIINFSGTVDYPGSDSQRITGSQSIAPVPLVPSVLLVTFDADAHITWQAVVQEGILGYRVYRSEEGGDYVDISGLILDENYVDFSVQYGTSYQYKVISENTTGAMSDPAESQASEPDGPSMIRRQVEDYDFEGGNFPGGQSEDGFPASFRSDLDDTDFFFQNASQTNEYRPDDPMAIPAFNAEEHYVGSTSSSDWWRFTFDLADEGYVKIGAIRAATDGDVTVEFLWDESHKGWFFLNTGGLHNWQILPVDTPAFYSTWGPHTLRIMLSEGSANLDYFGIGFQQPEPSRLTLFRDDFESYTTTEDMTSESGGWEILNGCGVPEGAWQLWSTTAAPLGYESADLPGMTGQYVVSDSEFAGLAEMDEELISPEINCTGYVKVTVQFGSNIRIYGDDFSTYEQVYDLDVSTYDEGTQSWSEWVNAFRHQGTDGDDSSPPRVDISGLADGKKIKLRWRFYEASYDYWWAVDNVRVTAEEPPAGPGKIVSVAISGTTVSLAWESFGTGSYRVQYTDDLRLGLWSDVPGESWPISAQQWSGDDLSASKSRFYRVMSE